MWWAVCWCVSTGFKHSDKESIVFHEAIKCESCYKVKGTLAVGIDTTSYDALYFRGKFILLSVVGSHLKSAQGRQTKRRTTLTGSQGHHSLPGKQANKPPECDSFGALSFPHKVGGEGEVVVEEGRRVLFPRLLSVRRLYTEGIGASFLIHTSLLGYYLLQKTSWLPCFPKQALSTS